MANAKEASRRWMYGGKHPNRLAKFLNRGTAAVAGAGIGPERLVELEVRGASLDSFEQIAEQYPVFRIHAG